MSKRRLAPSENVSDIEDESCTPERLYGDFNMSGDEIRERNRRMKFSRAARKLRPITLPTTPFDWKSDPVTSGPTSPSAPDVSAAVVVPSSSATATAATNSTDRR